MSLGSELGEVYYLRGGLMYQLFQPLNNENLIRPELVPQILTKIHQNGFCIGNHGYNGQIDPEDNGLVDYGAIQNKSGPILFMDKPKDSIEYSHRSEDLDCGINTNVAKRILAKEGYAFDCQPAHYNSNIIIDKISRQCHTKVPGVKLR
jgi:hypothetical protein